MQKVAQSLSADGRVITVRNELKVLFKLTLIGKEGEGVHTATYDISHPERELCLKIYPVFIVYFNNVDLQQFKQGSDESTASEVLAHSSRLFVEVTTST